MFLLFYGSSYQVYYCLKPRKKTSIDFYEDYYEYGTWCTLHTYDFKF